MFSHLCLLDGRSSLLPGGLISHLSSLLLGTTVAMFGAVVALLGTSAGVPASAPASALVDASASTRWLPPLDPPLHISGPYRAPPGPYASGHRGIDLPAKPGAIVIAPVAGNVNFAGTVVDRGVVSVRVDADTVLSIEPVDPGSLPNVGDSVERGQVLGTSAAGGHCAEECIHLGVRVDGEYVNPGRYFFAKPVLLPW